MTDLSDLRDRLENQFFDADNLIFSSANLDEAIRSALAEIATVYGFPLTLEGLDLADETNLESVDMPGLVTGAAAYALDFLLRSRFNDFSLNQEADASLMAWSGKLRRQFEASLDALRLRWLQNSADAPSSEWAWDETYTWDAGEG